MKARGDSRFRSGKHDEAPADTSDKTKPPRLAAGRVIILVSATRLKNCRS
jgi:hypothetical protein